MGTPPELLMMISMVHLLLLLLYIIYIYSNNTYIQDCQGEGQKNPGRSAGSVRGGQAVSLGRFHRPERQNHQPTGTELDTAMPQAR